MGDIVMGDGTMLGHIVELLQRIPVRWWFLQDGSTVEHQTGLATLLHLQTAAVGTVARYHREIAVVVAREHCTSFVTCNEIAAVFADPEGIPRRIASRFLAFVALRTAGLERSRSLQYLVHSLQQGSSMLSSESAPSSVATV